SSRFGPLPRPAMAPERAPTCTISLRRPGDARMDRYLSWGMQGVIGLCLMGLATGCATIAGGGHDQKVKIDSDPPKAQVFIDGKPAGTTPTEVCLNRNVDHEVVIEKPGFEPYQAQVKSGLNPWIFGNLVVGGIVGVAVDVTCDAC